MSMTKKLETPEKHIPFGHYCYENSRNEPCPFWDSKPEVYPNHEDGYCHYLNKSDWDLNEEGGGSKIIFVGDDGDQSIVGETMEEVFGDDEIDQRTGKKIHFTTSLMWDQVKECGINMREPDDTVIIQYDTETKKSTTTTAGEIRNA